MSRALLSVLLTLGVACGDDVEPTDQAERPLVAGPFAGDLPMTEDTRLALPSPESAVGTDATVRVYWFHPEGAGRALSWTVRAEAVAAVEQGSLIHEERVELRSRQGMVAFSPSHLSRGGARRAESGRLEWSPGLYSVTARLGSADGPEVGQVLFEVR
jgi:hypothetical protein